MVNDGLQGIAFGLVPQIHLPASLSKPATMIVASSDEDTFSPATKKKQKKCAKEQELEQCKTRTTPHSNLTPIKTWLLPKGKSYKDFFNPENGNTAERAPLCTPSQTEGSPVPHLHEIPDGSWELCLGVQ
jgi:hypothetical protein